MTVASRRAASTRRRSRLRHLERGALGRGGLGLLDLGLGGVEARRRPGRRCRPCWRPCGPRGRARARSRPWPSDALGGGQRLLEDHDLDRALEVVDRREHHRRAAAGADLLGLGDHAADLHPLAVLALGDLGDRAVGLDLQRLAHALERVLGDVDADRLLLHRQQLRRARTRASGSAGATARRTRSEPPARRRSRRGRRSSPGRSAASCWDFWPAACAESSTSSMPLAGSPPWSRRRRT